MGDRGPGAHTDGMENIVSARIAVHIVEDSPMENATAGGTTVFIVEDSPIVHERLVEMMLDAKGVSIAGHADNANDAIEGILRTRPDWVLLDLQLINSSGIEVLRGVRERVPDTGFIVMTNFNTPQYRRICTEAGASHFLDKTQATLIKEIVTGPKYSLRLPGKDK